MNIDNYPMSTIYELLKLTNSFYIKNYTSTDITQVYTYDNCFRHGATFEYINFLEPIFKQRFKDRIPFNDYGNDKSSYTKDELNALYESEIVIYQAMPDATMDENLDKIFQKNRIRHILIEYIRTCFDGISNVTYRPEPTDFDYVAVKRFLKNIDSAGFTEFVRASSTIIWACVIGGFIHLGNLNVTQSTMDNLKSFFPTMTNSELCNIVTFFIFILMSGLDTRYNSYDHKPFMVDFIKPNTSFNQNLDEVPGYINIMDIFAMPGFRKDKVMFVQGTSSNIVKTIDVDKLKSEHITHMQYNSAGGTLDIEFDLTGLNREDRDHLVGCFGLGHKIIIYRRSPNNVSNEYDPHFIINTNLKNNSLSIIATNFVNLSQNVAACVTMARQTDYNPTLLRFFGNLCPLFGYSWDIQRECRGGDQTWSGLLQTSVGANSKSVNNLIKIAKAQGVVVEPTYFVNTTAATSFTPCVLFSLANKHVRNSQKALRVIQDVIDVTFINSTTICGSKINYNDYECWLSIYSTIRGDETTLENLIELNESYGDNDVVESKWIRRVSLTGNDGFTLNRFVLPNFCVNDFDISKFLTTTTATTPLYNIKYDGTSTYKADEIDEFIPKEKLKLLKNQRDLYENDMQQTILQDFTFELDSSGIFNDNLLIVIDGTEYLFTNYNYQYDYVEKTIKILINTEPKITDNVGDE